MNFTDITDIYLVNYLDCFSEYSDKKPVSVGVESVMSDSDLLFSTEKDKSVYSDVLKCETIISRWMSLRFM